MNKILAVTLALTCMLAPVSSVMAAPKTSVSDSNGNSNDTRPAHLRTLEIALAALPTDASQVTADGLADLQAKIQAATDAVEACRVAGSKDKKIESVDGYDRLAPAQDRAAFLAAAVAAVNADNSALAVGYGEGDKDTLVTQNLTLPTAGSNGATITWASDNAAVVATDGTVVRPAAGAGDAHVTLTATLAKDTATATKTFAVTVKDLSPVDVQLLTINDLHGKIDQSYPLDITGDGKIDGTYGRIDYVASYLRELKAKNPANTLMVHDGDATGGSSPVSSLNKEEPTVEILNALGFDGGTVGNHEFDKGVDELLRLKNGGQPSATPNYQGMKYPLIAANVEYKDTHDLVLPPYFVKNVGGEKVGFIGVVTQSAAGMVMPAGIANIQFTDETAAVNKYAQELKAKGAKSIVVLAHMDASQDAKTGAVTGPAADLATNADPEVDVILAAHNHKVVNGTVNGKLVMQAFEYGKAVGDVNLTIDPATHDIVKKSADIVYVDQSKVQPDAEVGGILNKYLDAIKPRLEEVEGTAALPMAGGYAAVSDNALGNLIADSMRYEMQSDFALMNGGGIRDSIHEGPITWGELFNILPFNNILERLEITGADLTTILNAQISKSYGGDFSVGGFKYTWDSATFKVTSITLPDGTPIDPNKTYTLTVNNFMATATSSKYAPMGKLGKNPVIGPEDLPALVDYVKQYQGPIAYKPEGRIAVTTSNVAVQNLAGATDTVTVSAVRGGNVVRLYRNAEDSTPFATKTVAAGQTSVTFNDLDLGAATGTFHFSMTYDSKPSTYEGIRVPVQFQGE